MSLAASGYQISNGYDFYADQKPYVIRPGWQIAATIVQNDTTATITLTDDNGHSQTVAPGTQRTLLWGTTYGLTAQSQSAGAGRGILIAANYQLPPSSETQGTIPVNITNGVINIAASGLIPVNISSQSSPINVAITSSGTIPVSIQSSGTLDVAIVSSATLPVSIGAAVVNVAISSSGTIPVQLNASSITLSTSDTIVENNTGTLLGLLASSSSVFTLAPFTQNQSVIVKAIASFALTAFIVGAGRLNVWYVANSETQWLLKDVPFYASPIVSIPLEKRFNTPLPAGASLYTRWDDATANASFVLSQ